MAANQGLRPWTSSGGEKHHIQTHLQVLQTTSHQAERNHLSDPVPTGERLTKCTVVENTACIGFPPTDSSMSQETAVKNPDPDAENNDAAVETQRFLTSLKESMEQNEGTAPL